jgi:hypothetical protein
MAEVRNQYEGTLFRVAGSGSGTAWTTASGASGLVMAFVRNFTWTSARTDQVIYERGIPSHHKTTQQDAVQVSFTVDYGITGNYPTATTGDGSTVALDMIELRMTAPEAGASMYLQFFGVDWNNRQFTEANPANTFQWQGVALRMNGPTASGYLG